MVAGRRALLAHPGEYPPCPRDVSGEILLVIGPEGGFIPYEVEQLQRGRLRDGVAWPAHPACGKCRQQRAGPPVLEHFSSSRPNSASHCSHASIAQKSKPEIHFLCRLQ